MLKLLCDGCMVIAAIAGFGFIAMGVQFAQEEKTDLIGMDLAPGAPCQLNEEGMSMWRRGLLPSMIAPIARFVGCVPKRPYLIVMQVPGKEEPEIWHRSFWRIVSQ
jgi:hypothetical protein